MNSEQGNRATGVKTFVRLGLLALIIWMGWLVIDANYQPIRMGFSGVFKYMKYLLFFVFLVITLVVDGVNFAKNKEVFQFLPTTIGMIFLIFILIRLFAINSMEGAKVSFKVKSVEENEELNLQIEFKEAGVFKFIEPSKQGPTYAFGKYEMEDSVITILDFNFPGYTLPSKLTFSGDTLNAGKVKFVVDDI